MKTTAALLLMSSVALSAQQAVPLPKAEALSAQQFQALSPQAEVLVKGEKITKQKLLQRLPRPTDMPPQLVKSLEQVRRAFHEAQLKKIDAANAVLVQAHPDVSGPSSGLQHSAIKGGPLTAQLAGPTDPNAPKVTDIIPINPYGQPIATPGGLIAIKGERLQPFFKGGSGKVFLKGSFPGGGVQLEPQTQQGGGQSIMLKVPAGILGVPDHQATLSFITQASQTIKSPKPVSFYATRAVTTLDASCFTPLSISSKATLENAAAPSTQAQATTLFVYHRNLPYTLPVEGTDTFKVRLPAGWAWSTYAWGMANMSGVMETWECLKNGICKSHTLSGDVLTCHWRTPQTGYEETSTSKVAYWLSPFVIGPAGVPAK